MIDLVGEKLPSDLSRVQFEVKNAGSIPARLVHKATQPWVDGGTRPATDHMNVDVVFPGETQIISSFDLNGELPSRVIVGTSDLRYAIAVLYESTTKDDTRRWVTDAWIVFSSRKKAFAIRKRDEIQVESETRLCDLQRLQPSDWLSWKPPPLVSELNIMPNKTNAADAKTRAAD